MKPAKDIFISFAGTGFLQVGNAIAGILAARLLLPEGRGELAALMLWPLLFASLALFSLDQGVAYFTATNRRHAPSYLTSALSAGAALSMVAVIATYLLLPQILGSYPARTSQWFNLTLLLIPGYIITQITMGYLQGHHRFFVWNTVRVVLPVGYLVGILFFFWLHGQPEDSAADTGLMSSSVAAYQLRGTGVRDALAAFICSLGLATALGLAVTFRPTLKTAWDLSWSRAKNLFRYSGSVHLASTTSLVSLRLDKALISIFLTAIDLGLYVVAFTLSEIANTAATTISYLAFPAIASQTTPVDKATMFGRYLRLSFALVFVISAIIILFAPWVLATLYGKAFQASADIVRILIFGSLLYAMRSTLVAGFKAYDLMVPVTRAELVGLIVSATLLPVALPTFRLPGAAWVYIITQGVVTVLLIRSLKNTLGLTLTTLLKPTREDFTLLAAGIRSALRRQAT